MVWICAYRDWAKKIYTEVNLKTPCILIQTLKEFKDQSKFFNKNDKIFFIGWSWIVPGNIVNNYNCICLHPSPLPKYRGGSPLQHQIINGESSSAVTLFKMDSGIDTGEILFQKEFSLLGELNDIFNQIIDLGTQGVLCILTNNFTPTKQDELQSTFFKRRTPDQSEITLKDLKTHSAKNLHNKIRALQTHIQMLLLNVLMEKNYI